MGGENVSESAGIDRRSNQPDQDSFLRKPRIACIHGFGILERGEVSGFGDDDELGTRHRGGQLPRLFGWCDHVLCPRPGRASDCELRQLGRPVGPLPSPQSPATPFAVFFFMAGRTRGISRRGGSCLLGEQPGEHRVGDVLRVPGGLDRPGQLFAIPRHLGGGCGRASCPSAWRTKRSVMHHKARAPGRPSTGPPGPPAPYLKCVEQLDDVAAIASIVYTPSGAAESPCPRRSGAITRYIEPTLVSCATRSCD